MMTIKRETTKEGLGAYVTLVELGASGRTTKEGLGAHVASVELGALGSGVAGWALPLTRGSRRLPLMRESVQFSGQRRASYEPQRKGCLAEVLARMRQNDFSRT